MLARELLTPMKDNPLLVESTLPFRYPRFDAIGNEHFAPAFEQGMAEHAKEIEAIATNAEKPSFDNTIVAMEKAGQLLALQRAIAPRLAAHQDSITLDPALFARVKALYESREGLGPDAESKRLLWRYYRDFVRAGAQLATLLSRGGGEDPGHALRIHCARWRTSSRGSDAVLAALRAARMPRRRAPFSASRAPRSWERPWRPRRAA